MQGGPAASPVGPTSFHRSDLARSPRCHDPPLRQSPFSPNIFQMRNGGVVPSATITPQPLRGWMGWTSAHSALLFWLSSATWRAAAVAAAPTSRAISAASLALHCLYECPGVEGAGPLSGDSRPRAHRMKESPR